MLLGSKYILIVLKEESMWTVEETQLSMEQFLPSQIKQESQGLADADELNSIGMLDPLRVGIL